MFSRRIVPAAILTAAVTALCGCGAQSASAPAPASPTSSPAAAVATAPASAAASPQAVPSATGAALTIVDPWVKTAKKGMSAAFGTLVNDTGTDVTVVSASSPLSPKVELHEVVDSGDKMIMRPKKGGFVVPAHGTYPLQPGGDHLMLMGVTEEVMPGAQIPFALALEGGGKLEFTAVGKDFAGGREDYQPGMDMGKEQG
ncbi:copper chaperone PCu(A)C [Streptosporangium sp. NPDC051022]|uniref:copper chaperone PCu(A)C n=1 Tax=Streptosporangium sp. NPDC051022 TaxID=3155752 RepID=UPI003437F7ED